MDSLSISAASVDICQSDVRQSFGGKYKKYHRPKMFQVFFFLLMNDVDQVFLFVLFQSSMATTRSFAACAVTRRPDFTTEFILAKDAR